jgi:hypothetical protein
MKKCNSVAILPACNLVCASATILITILFIVASDDFAGLAPFEVVRVEERVDEDDNVHKWRCKQVHNVACKVLCTLKVVAW